MLDSNSYSILSTARFLSVLNAEQAIKSNNLFAYHQAETIYEFINRQIQNDEVASFLDARIPQDRFPEWPPVEQRVVFSDEEIASWPDVPVVFSDGDIIDDTVDVPF